MAQWLRIWASTAGDVGSIPSWGPKILHAMQYSQKKKKRMHIEIDSLKNALEVLKPFEREKRFLVSSFLKEGF